jgi:hypothetical protein
MGTSASGRLEALRQKIDRLAEAGVVKPAPPSERAAADLERVVGELPGDYRALIATVADGIGGTELVAAEAAAPPLEEGETLEAFAARPFPFDGEDARRALARIAKLAPDDDTLTDRDLYGKRERIHGGYLCLGEEGSTWPVLVLRGDQRGKVWYVGDEHWPAYVRDGAALVPCDFLAWLDAHLDEVEERARDQADRARGAPP